MCQDDAGRLGDVALAPALGDAVTPRAEPRGQSAFDATAWSALNARLAELLRSAALGSVPAFEEFYAATLGNAAAVVRSIAGANHLEDVLSEAYFQAWRQAGLFDAGRGHALGWLLSIARSRALDKLRAERSCHGGAVAAPEARDDGEASPLPGPDALLEALQERGRLHDVMAELSASERWVVALAYYRDLSHREIACATDFPLGTVKATIRRAQLKLRRLLDAPAAARVAL